jgi:hypothetical protein
MLHHVETGNIFNTSGIHDLNKVLTFLYSSKNLSNMRRTFSKRRESEEKALASVPKEHRTSRGCQSDVSELWR